MRSWPFLDFTVALGDSSKTTDGEELEAGSTSRLSSEVCLLTGLDRLSSPCKRASYVAESNVWKPSKMDENSFKYACSAHIRTNHTKPTLEIKIGNNKLTAGSSIFLHPTPQPKDVEWSSK